MGDISILSVKVLPFRLRRFKNTWSVFSSRLLLVTTDGSVLAFPLFLMQGRDRAHHLCTTEDVALHLVGSLHCLSSCFLIRFTLNMGHIAPIWHLIINPFFCFSKSSPCTSGLFADLNLKK